MQTITAHPNQSMQDLVLMACGSLDGAMAFCRANGVSISDVPVPGNEYIIPAGIDLDDVALTGLAQRGIVIGTLNLPLPPTPPAYFGIILYPMMAASVVYPIGGGLFDLVLTATSDFINTNPLPALWPGPNLLRTMLKSVYDVSGAVGAATVTPYVTLQSDKVTRYFIGSALTVADRYLWWSDLPTGWLGATAAYEDTAGWNASCAPLVMMPTTGGPLTMHTFIGTISLAYNGTAGPYSFAVTFGHTPLTLADVLIAGQGLLYRLAGTSGPWAAIPTMPGVYTAVATFPPGIYELALWTQYSGGTGGYPASAITMVFEVY